MNHIVEDLQEYFSQEVTYHISARDLEELLIFKVYKKRIEMTESLNDSTHEFIVEAKNDEYEYDKETVEKALQNGYMPCWQYYTILNDLCSKGHIKPGRYFIRVSW